MDLPLLPDLREDAAGELTLCFQHESPGTAGTDVLIFQGIGKAWLFLALPRGFEPLFSP